MRQVGGFKKKSNRTSDVADKIGLFVGRVGAELGRKKLTIENTREMRRDESSVLDKSMPAGGIEEGVEGD